jgi:hypothetical protein
MNRHVYPGDEIAHLYAANRDVYVFNSARSVTATGGVLYSYSEPIAAWIADRLVMSSDSFSRTTTKHKYWAFAALHHLNPIFVPNLKRLLKSNNELSICDYIADRVSEIADIRKSMERMRAEWKKQEAQNLIARLETACEIAWNLKLGKKTHWSAAIKVKEKIDRASDVKRFTHAHQKMESGMETAQRMMAECRENMAKCETVGEQVWYLDRAISNIGYIDELGARLGFGFGASTTFLRAEKVMGKKWAKEHFALAAALVDYAESFRLELDRLRAEKLRAESLADAERVTEWLAGGRYAPRGAVICRVVGDTVETSKGARVPLADALSVVEIARKCREAGKGIDLAGRQIGNYRGTQIDAEGNLTVGCHFITWEAIADAVARYESAQVVA